MKEYLYDGKVIGRLDNGVFSKTVSKKRHLFKRLHAWGVQFKTAEELLKDDCKLIEITDKDEKKTYSIDFDVFMKNGTLENFGFGQQVFLPLHWWTINKIT